jgi:hypothetical protein
VPQQTPISYSIKVPQFKGGFMDRAWVKRALGPLAARALAIFGVRVRRGAQGRIVDRDRQTSQPGEGPTNQTGMLREFIFFAFSPQIGGGLGGVVVGPAKLNGKQDDVPSILEHGGTTTVQVYERVKGGPRERRGDKIVRIAPRPYMMPAFEDVYPNQMPDIWERAATGR